MRQCLKEEEVWEYLIDKESGNNNISIQAHIAQCNSCKKRLQEIEASHVELQNSLKYEPLEPLTDSFEAKVISKIRKSNKANTRLK